VTERPERLHQRHNPGVHRPDDPHRYLVDTSVLPSPGNVPDPEESK
jgi:hypothetical protein